MKKVFFMALVGAASQIAVPTVAQVKPTSYLKNLHSHNDYTRNHPFALAYGLGFGSIEVDLFLKDRNLYVAHEYEEITPENTFERLYLEPIIAAFENTTDGFLYPENGRLQLLIDPKSDGHAVLKLLSEKLQPYRDLFDSKNNPKAVKIVISGNRPTPEEFHLYDNIFYFDGEFNKNYTTAQLERIGLFSAPFSQLSMWNGLGRLIRQDSITVKNAIDSVHRLGKEVRFWAAPDTKTTWYEWMKFGIDYINTDQPMAAAEFMRSYSKNSFSNNVFYKTYLPKKKSNASVERPKNIILLISDGAGLSQLWAAAMANKGQLNVLNMPYTGYLFTSSTDNYHTDSAAGGSALATGVKTRNRFIGVDTTGRPVDNLPDLIARAGMVGGVVSNDGITGATPSAFYAHVRERNNADSIAAQLVDSKLSLMVGGSAKEFATADSLVIKQLRERNVEIVDGADHIARSKSDRLLVFAQDQVDREWNKLRDDQNEAHTAYRLIEDVFRPSVSFLEDRSADKGFFLMVEGAKIDGGGHSNSIPFTVTEYLSFDRLVGQALQYADLNGETLVLVTSDHETGGLVLLDANRQKGQVLGNFATTDHTGIPVPLMSYGPGAEIFQGFLDNTDIVKRIRQLLELPSK
ncbi:MAG: alkaline phosphatase [Sphingobacterium sp.]